MMRRLKSVKRRYLGGPGHGADTEYVLTSDARKLEEENTRLRKRITVLESNPTSVTIKAPPDLDLDNMEPGRIIELEPGTPFATDEEINALREESRIQSFKPGSFAHALLKAEGDASRIYRVAHEGPSYKSVLKDVKDIRSLFAIMECADEIKSHYNWEVRG